MSSAKDQRLGTYRVQALADESFKAFVPAPLPPVPPLDLRTLIGPLSVADRAIGRLDGIGRVLPDAALFIYMYVRKEALLSSQIEGMQSTIDELLKYEAAAASGDQFDDIREVSNYVKAVTYGLDRMTTLPISLRLIRELHLKLLDSGRGKSKNPGEFRRSQNWIGGTRPGNALFVPPPISDLDQCLDALEKFIHAPTPDIPPLIKAGLIHVQFETIHPFLDGNGRLGRLLITLFLCSEGILTQPLLYLSLYLKQHREDYYRLLQEVRERGAWENWLEFFLAGIAATAEQAHTSAVRILDLFERHRTMIERSGSRVGSVLRVHEHLQRQPYATVQTVHAASGLSVPTINSVFADLVAMRIVAETTGKKRDRVYAYRDYLAILSEGAAPLSRS